MCVCVSEGGGGGGRGTFGVLEPPNFGLETCITKPFSSWWPNKNADSG